MRPARAALWGSGAAADDYEWPVARVVDGATLVVDASADLPPELALLTVRGAGLGGGSVAMTGPVRSTDAGIEAALGSLGKTIAAGPGGAERSGGSPATSGRPPGSLFAEGGAGARALNKARLAGERRDGGGLSGLPARRAAKRRPGAQDWPAFGEQWLGAASGPGRSRITTATGRD